MQEMQQRIKDYWTKRSHDFGIVRHNELHDAISEHWLLEMYRYLPQGRKLKILDIGTGTGYFAVLLAQQGHELTGIDLTGAMLEEAEILAASHRADVDFIAMDAQKLEFETASFDAIVTRNLTWTLPDPEAAYTEWRRVLRSGGILLNFDADYGNNVRNNEEQGTRLPVNQVYGHCGITEELERENAEITLSMPISRKARPLWDVDFLKKCGFSEAGFDDRVGERILGDKNLADAPLFLVWAKA